MISILLSFIFSDFKKLKLSLALNPQKMNNLKISVAIATYNGEKYIYDQIQSILDQSLLLDEIVNLR